MRRPISISLRLTLWFGCIFMAGWVLFGISMWANLATTLRHERRMTLTRRLDRLQDLLQSDRAASPGDRYQDFADFAHATGNGLAEVLRADGTAELAPPSRAAAKFPWPQVAADQPNLFVTVQADGQPYWVLARPFQLGERRLVLLAAAPEAGNLVVMRSFLEGLLASIPILLLISSAGGYWLSRRALRPVDRIAATARSISIRNISERVPVGRSGDELQRLAETCNQMLDRLESSVSQIKRFTADASHELRGPLAFIRTEAELALKHPSSDVHSRRALQAIVDEVAQAALLLDAMLTLARADSAPAALPLVSLPLGAMLQEVCAMAAPLAEQSGLQLTLQQSAELQVLGDAPSLRRLLWILLDNAIKYSRPGGCIRVRVSAEAEQVCVAVQDEGIGIAAADLPLIFDRFYRADPSRGLVEGSGLGLAIARWIAETHQAQLEVTSELDHGSTFALRLPRSHTVSTPAQQDEAVLAGAGVVS